MGVESVALVHRGQTFVGFWEMVDRGGVASVHVRYEDQEIETGLHGLPASEVAMTLLRDLVLFAANVPRAASARPAPPLERSRQNQAA